MPHARTTDPVTSHEAAASVKNLTATQEVIMEIFRKTAVALTDESLVLLYYRERAHGAPYSSESGIRSRRAELTQIGKLRDSGNRSKTITGRNAILWELANV